MTASAPQQPPIRTPWGLMLLLGAMTAAGPVAIDLYLPSLPSIGASLHASSAQTQMTVAMFFAGMAVGQFFYGPASDRLGRKPAILVGMTIYVAASVVCALAASPGVLIGARFVEALGGCAGAVVARAVVRDRFTHIETARMLSLMTLIMGMAPILAPLLGGLILNLFGWRGNFWFLTLFGLAVVTATVLWLPESRSAETSAQAATENPLQSYRALLGNPRLVGYALAGGLNGAALLTYVSASPDLLINIYKIPPGQFGWVFGLNAVGLIGASQINRLLLRWIAPEVIVARAGLVSAFTAVALAVAAATGWGERWSILPLLFVLLSSYGFMQGNIMAGALNVDPRRAGSISALMGGASFAVGALASSLAGAMHDGTARPMAMTILIAMIGSMAALRLLALRSPQA